MKFIHKYGTFLKRILEDISIMNETIQVYHISKDPIESIDNRFLNKQIPRDKPEGLWFTYDKSRWKDFFYSTTNDYFTYEITINTSRLIRLDSINKINWFNEKYKSGESIYKQDGPVQEVFGSIWTSPNWLEVKRDYHGIEFPNFEELKTEIDFNDIKNNWLTFIDVNSGCVWNVESIINYKEI